jgi:hypothetical protein
MSNNVKGPSGSIPGDIALSATVAGGAAPSDPALADTQAMGLFEVCEQAVEQVAKAFAPPEPSFLSDLLPLFGEQRIDYVNLNESQFAMLDLNAPKSGGLGAAHVLTIGQQQYAIIDVGVPETGERIVGVYQSPDALVPQWVHDSDESKVFLADGGQLHVEWYDTLDADGNVVPGNKIKVSYIPPHLVEGPPPPAPVSPGTAEVRSEGSSAVISSGERVPLPPEGINESIVRVGQQEFQIVSVNGKVAFWNDHENGEASRLHGKPKIFYNSSSRLSIPAFESPFVVSPEGDLYFVENVIDRLLIEEIVKAENRASSLSADHGMPRLSNIDTFGEPRISSILIYDPAAKTHGSSPFHYAMDAAEFSRLTSESQPHPLSPASFVCDNAGGPGETHAGSFGRYFGNGTFNVLGGAMVVVGSEAIGGMRGEPLSQGEEAVAGIGTFYGLTAWMEAASAGGAQSVDWVLFNSNFAKASPVAAVAGAPIFYGASQLVEETGVDPASFEGSLATTTVGGAGLALVLQAEMPAALTVGSYTTGASLMSGAALTEVGGITASGIVLVEGALVLGSGYAGYRIGQTLDKPIGMFIYMVDKYLTGPIADEVSKIYPAAGEVIDDFTDVGQEDGDVSLSGWLAGDWKRPAVIATLTMGPVAGLYVYLGDKLYKHFTATHPSEQ